MRRCLFLASLLVPACQFERPPNLDPVDAREVDAPDAPPPVPGGSTIALLQLPTGTYTSTGIAEADDGGLYVSMLYSSPVPFAIGNTVVPCNQCAVLLKLDRSLQHIDWYQWATGIAIRSARLATSPSHEVFWALAPETGVDADLMVGSSVDTTFGVHVVGGELNGTETGAARVAIAYTNGGMVRWHQDVRLLTPGTASMSEFVAFAASEHTLMATLFGGGTIEFRGADGAITTTNAGTSAALSLDLDSSTGYARRVAVAPTTAGSSRFQSVTGVPGLASQGFAVRGEWFSPSNALLSEAIDIGRFENAGFTSLVHYDTTIPTSELRSMHLRYVGPHIGLATAVGTTTRIGSTTLAATGGHGDMACALLDNDSPTVLSTVTIGGNGAELPVAPTSSGDDGLYCGGTYTSTDLRVGGAAMPVPPTSTAVFLTELYDDQGTLSPAWSRGFVGTAGTELLAIEHDTVSNDLYAVLSNRPGGATDPGNGPIGGVFIVKLKRGGP